MSNVISLTLNDFNASEAKRKADVNKFQYLIQQLQFAAENGAYRAVTTLDNYEIDFLRSKGFKVEKFQHKGEENVYVVSWYLDQE